MAISAVSRSRISPTITTSGSCRSTARSASGKPSPGASVHLDLDRARAGGTPPGPPASPRSGCRGPAPTAPRRAWCSCRSLSVPPAGIDPLAPTPRAAAARRGRSGAMPERFQVPGRRVGVQDAHDRLLSAVDGQRADPQSQPAARRARGECGRPADVAAPRCPCPPRTLTRDSTARAGRGRKLQGLPSIPSIRSRTRTSSPVSSRWMSLARPVDRVPQDPVHEAHDRGGPRDALEGRGRNRRRALELGRKGVDECLEVVPVARPRWHRAPTPATRPRSLPASRSGTGGRRSPTGRGGRPHDRQRSRADARPGARNGLARGTRSPPAVRRGRERWVGRA